MSEEKAITEAKVKRARATALFLSTITVLAIMFAMYANIQRMQAERRVELIEKLNKLQLDSCSVRNEDLTNYMQELMYTLEYEKKKNLSK